MGQPEVGESLMQPASLQRLGEGRSHLNVHHHKNTHYTQNGIKRPIFDQVFGQRTQKYTKMRMTSTSESKQDQGAEAFLDSGCCSQVTLSLGWVTQPRARLPGCAQLLGPRDPGLRTDSGVLFRANPIAKQVKSHASLGD